MQGRVIDRLGLYYEPEAYSVAGKRLMGRQAAGVGFLKAVIKAGPGDLWCYARSQQAAEAFGREIGALGGGGIRVHWTPFLKPEGLAEAGLLYRPDPGISNDAWRRLNHAAPRAYSLCGVTHTTASHAVMDSFAGLLTAPLEDWDAVVCTSRSVRDSLKSIVENEAEYLRERVGATRLTLPQLPVIPLGVHCGDFLVGESERQAARQALGIRPDETVVLFVGRLSFHGKAHPVAMYLALEACAKKRPVVLLQAGWFANENIEKAFKSDAQLLCPSVRCLYAEGRDAARRRQAWAAADIFTSLSDNIQETFGLTPIEAMAAGLPVVVSDWNGYRETVRDGVDGFRVPTLTLPAGYGGVFADRYDIGVDGYDFYSGATSQHIAVDVDAAAEAYRKLIDDPGLRRSMGAAGRERARAEFDWSQVILRYADLWQDLHERRRAAPDLAPPLKRRRRPERADPFEMFATYPSEAVSAKSLFARRPGVDAEQAMARRKLATVPFEAVLPSDDLVAQILSALEDGAPRNPAQIAAACPRYARTAVVRALVWLAKVGVLMIGGERK